MYTSRDTQAPHTHTHTIDLAKMDIPKFNPPRLLTHREVTTIATEVIKKRELEKEKRERRNKAMEEFQSNLYNIINERLVQHQTKEAHLGNGLYIPLPEDSQLLKEEPNIIASEMVILSHRLNAEHGVIVQGDWVCDSDNHLCIRFGLGPTLT